MVSSDKSKSFKSLFKGFFNSIIHFRSSIYGRVIFNITILSLFLFASFGFIFRSVYEQYLNTVIRQSGNNVGTLVEGALYLSMVENDRKALQNTLDIINTMPGIQDVNMYDADNNLVYSSFSGDAEGHINPNCKDCHDDFSSMFPPKDKAYKIIDSDTECKMSDYEDDQRYLMIRSPILNERSCYTGSCHAHQATDEVLGSLVIKVPLRDLDAAVQKSSTKFYLIATLATVLLVTFLIIFTSKEIKNPLNALVKASVAVSNGDRNTRVEIKPNQVKDMKMVSLAFNDMLDNLQAATKELENWSQQLEYKVQKKSEELGAVQNEIIHIERLASLGKLSSSVAHEINNPLSGILIYTKLIHKQLSNPDLSEEKKESILKNLKLIEGETKRCGDIVKGLLDFSKKDQENFEPLHLHPLLDDTFELMMHPIKIANIAFLKDYGAKLDMVYCSPNQIKQACMAIIVNASEAIRENGEIRLRTSNPDENTIKIEIIDNGIGIPAEVLPHIFEPFFSTKQNASGIGLGLPIAHGIIQSHSGKIQVKSEAGRGTTISITLPLISA